MITCGVSTGCYKTYNGSVSDNENIHDDTGSSLKQNTCKFMSMKKALGARSMENSGMY